MNRAFRPPPPAALALACALVAAGCATRPAPAPPDAAPERAHHRGDRFQNRYLEFGTKPFEDFLRWRFNAWREGLPPPPKEPIPATAPDVAFIATNARAGAAMRPAVTWIGHATVLLQLGGLNVLTDPIFSERASPLDFVGPKRHQPPGLRLDQLPRIDVVVLSHDHYDSTDAASLAALARQPGGAPRFLVPLGMGTLLRSLGAERVEEFDWWQAYEVGDASEPGSGAGGPPSRAGRPNPTPSEGFRRDRAVTRFVFLPAQHWSGRRLDDRMRTLWGGWAILAPDLHAYFAGDTGYSRDFADIRAHFAAVQTKERGGGFDIALVPIGAYEPRWFMRDAHVNPDEAVRIHADVGAKCSLGIHWGTFPLTDEPLDQPPRDLAEARQVRGVADDAFFVLPIGGTKVLPRR